MLDNLLRDVVTALAGLESLPAYKPARAKRGTKTRGWIPRPFSLQKPGREAAARQRGFKRECAPRLGKLVKASQHDTTGLERGGLRREGGKSLAALDRSRCRPSRMGEVKLYAVAVPLSPGGFDDGTRDVERFGRRA